MKIQVIQEKCTGCRLCEQICTIHHCKEINPKKSAIRIKAEFPEPGIFIPKLCDQCGDCIEVCPTTAISKEEHAVVIDPDECTDCGACVTECPTEVIYEHPDMETPIICDLCLKCTEVCNTGALVVVDD